MYGAVASFGIITKEGMFKGALAFSHVEIDVGDAKSIREFVKNTSKAGEPYINDCGN